VRGPLHVVREELTPSNPMSFLLYTAAPERRDVVEWNPKTLA
jgi:hypothetical protein